MIFKTGDRVISRISDGEGLKEGEFGTVIEGSDVFDIPLIRWDEYNPIRHDAGGRTEMGHGWHVFSKEHVELYQEVNDLGEFHINLAPGSIEELFGE